MEPQVAFEKQLGAHLGTSLKKRRKNATLATEGGLMQGSPRMLSAAVGHSMGVCFGNQKLFHEGVEACKPLHPQTEAPASLKQAEAECRQSRPWDSKGDRHLVRSPVHGCQPVLVTAVSSGTGQQQQ